MDPRKSNTQSMMPSFGFSLEEAKAIVAYLESLDDRDKTK